MQVELDVKIEALDSRGTLILSDINQEPLPNVYEHLQYREDRYGSAPNEIAKNVYKDLKKKSPSTACQPVQVETEWSVSKTSKTSDSAVGIEFEHGQDKEIPQKSISEVYGIKTIQVEQGKNLSNHELIADFQKFSLINQLQREQELRRECVSWMILCTVIAVLFYYRGEKIFYSDCNC